MWQCDWRVERSSGTSSGKAVVISRQSRGSTRDKLALVTQRHRGRSSHDLTGGEPSETSAPPHYVWVGTMDPIAVVRAMEALTLPLEWGTQDAWLAESLRRVRYALGLRASAVGLDA